MKQANSAQAQPDIVDYARALRHAPLALALLLLPMGGWAIGVGDTAAPFTLTRLGGPAGTDATVSLEQLRGRVVYLDFWASWCAPCRISLPMLEDLHQRLHGEDFTVIALNLDDDPEAAMRFLRKLPVSFPVAWDDAGTVARSYALQAMPSSYLIDRDGTVHAVHHGFRKSRFAAIERQIMALLERP